MTTGRPVPVETRRVEIDPSIVAAVGRHHSLPTAVADVIDNSVDAGAQHVLVRVLTRDERVTGLLVVDDGTGMDTGAIDHALGYARKREYGETDLGHFGVGLKAASLSQADTLYVWSRAAGVGAVGRGLERRSLDAEPEVAVLSAADAAQRLSEIDPGFALATGTVVEWRDLRGGFRHSTDPDEHTAWLEQTLEGLRVHLGTVLHRVLARGGLDLRLDVLDEEYPEFGAVPREVEPLDPFGHPVSGAPGYPATLGIVLPDGVADALLHVWPSTAASDAGWALGGRSPLQTQGLYVYRRDRLLQAGGWVGLTNPHRDLVHARVAVDIDAVLAPHVTINPEKTGVALDSTLTASWAAGGTEDGRSFADYLDAARAGARTARRRNPSPIRVAEPGRGFTGPVVEALEDNAVVVGDGAVHVSWTGLPDDQVFQVDRDRRTVWLNIAYRAELGGGAGLRNDDAQVTKLLLHLLLGEHALGSYAGARARREEEAWQAMLLATVRAERSRRGAAQRDDQEEFS